MANFNAVVELSDLDGTDGFRMSGEAGDGQSGRSVSDAGDVNGDGFADLLIGAPFLDGSAFSEGAAYVVFGKAGGFAADLDLADLDGDNGFKVSGVAAGDETGFSVSGAGDVNRDGFDDVIMSVTGIGGAGAAAYVVFGKASGFDADIDPTTLDGTNGFRLAGDANSVSDAGDVNGDGFADLILGSPGDDPNGVSNAGASYVVFGKASGFAAEIDPAALDGSNGFRVSGAAVNDLSGYSVSSAGDVNGDGFDDLVIGAASDAYVVFGKAAGFTADLDLGVLDGTDGFKLTGAAGRGVGIRVSGAGDVNGDGYADLIVAASASPTNTNASGSSYVVFGKASGFDAAFDLADLDGTNGFRPFSAAAANTDISISDAGDVNGDGFADLIVGAPYGNPNGYASGTSYVVFGKAGGFDAALDLESLDGTDGFAIDGVATVDLSGSAVSKAGDVNGDGVDDLIVGAFFADANGADSGASYVIFGIQADLTITGTSGNNLLRGRSADDTISGLGGTDRLFGEAGEDTLTGGLGRDVLWGGTGADAFVIETWNDAQRGAAFDTIRDFRPAQGDKIDLSALGPLTWLGTQPFTGEAGEVRTIQGQNGTFVIADRDGDRVFDLKILLNGLVTLSEGDFIL